MNNLLLKIAECVEKGKINIESPYPPDMKGERGAYEFTQLALAEGIAPQEILSNGLIIGMEKIGRKFKNNEVFVPQVLMSAKAMSTAMENIKPLFLSGAVKRKGKFIIGTVTGDLHDIGKNLVSMVVEGNGWEVIDLGTDVSAEQFIECIKEHPDAFIGLSALLTTTMLNMEIIVKQLRSYNKKIKILVGGAPLNEDFKDKIGADFYAPDPQGAVEYLNQFIN